MGRASFHQNTNNQELKIDVSQNIYMRFTFKKLKTNFLRIIFFVLIILCCACGSPKKEVRNIHESYISKLDSTVIENSGLLLWKDQFWTFNDSGGKNELYGLDKKTGVVTITIQLANVNNVDWEDIAQDKNHIYIAETGNNAGMRKDLKIYRIKKEDITNNPIQSLIADSILFNFADQTDFTPAFRNTKWDCEALIFHNDSLYVFTKDWVTYITKVYGFPAKEGNYSEMPIDSFNVNGLITGADILHNGNFALIGYKDFHSFVWLFKKKKGAFFSNPHFIDLGFLENAQTEGICFSNHNDLFISCEQTVNYPQQIWKIAKENLLK